MVTTSGASWHRFERFSSGSPKAFINVLQESCFDY